MCFKGRILLAASFLAISCTVLEDRNPCPCRLSLDFREVDVRALQDLGFDALEWEIHSEEIIVYSFSFTDLPDSVEIEVPRGIDCDCLVRAVSRTMDESGGECPPVFFEKRKVPVSGEVTVDTVRLHKQYADMTIFFKSASLNLSGLRLVASCCGFDGDLELVHEDYVVGLSPSHGGMVRVRVPRQDDDSMRLEILDHGAASHTFSIGNYLSAGGYDWEAPDLDDIYLEIDCVASKLKLYTDIWQRSVSFSVNL